MERLSGGSVYDWAGFVFDRKNPSQNSPGDAAVFYLMQQDRDGNFTLLAHSAPLTLRCNQGCSADAPPFVQNVSAAPGLVTISLLSQFVEGSARCGVNVEHTFKGSGSRWSLVQSHFDRHVSPAGSNGGNTSALGETIIDYQALTGQATVTQFGTSGRAHVQKLTLPAAATTLDSFGDADVLKLPESDGLPSVCASGGGSSSVHSD
jgi:hypothetical protein